MKKMMEGAVDEDMIEMAPSLNFYAIFSLFNYSL